MFPATKRNRRSKVSIWGGIGTQEVTISCQMQYLEINRENSLFHLQTVSFWALEKGPEIAEFSPFSISADPGSDLAITPTTK